MGKIKQNKQRNFRLKLYYVLAVPLAVLGVIAVFLAIESAAYGAKLVALDKSVASLKAQNRELSSQLVEATSLKDLSGKTEELGYGKPENILYISSDTMVARLP